MKLLYLILLSGCWNTNEVIPDAGTDDVNVVVTHPDAEVPDASVSCDLTGSWRVSFVWGDPNCHPSAAPWAEWFVVKVGSITGGTSADYIYTVEYAGPGWIPPCGIALDAAACTLHTLCTTNDGYTTDLTVLRTNTQLAGVGTVSSANCNAEFGEAGEVFSEPSWAPDAGT